MQITWGLIDILVVSQTDTHTHTNVHTFDPYSQILNIYSRDVWNMPRTKQWNRIFELLTHWGLKQKMFFQSKINF